MLKRLRVKGYKSLRDMEMTFDPLMVLVGPNGSGKSNILDAIQLLSRLVKVEEVQDAFALPHRGTAVQSLHIPMDGVRPEGGVIEIEAEIEISKSSMDRYTGWEPSRDAASGEILVDPHVLAAMNISDRPVAAIRVEVDVGASTGEIVLRSAVCALKGQDSLPLGKWSRDQDTPNGGWNVEYPRQKPRVEGMGGVSLNAESHSYRFSMLFEAWRFELNTWLSYALDPRGAMRFPAPVVHALRLSSDGGNLASLIRTLKADHKLKFMALKNALRVVMPNITDLTVELDRNGRAELLVHEGERKFTAEVASEGTLRLIALFAMRASPNRPLLTGIEEPENGIPPRRLREIAEYLKNSVTDQHQVVVATHSPDLPDYLDPASVRIVTSSNGETKVRPLNPGLVEDLRQKREEISDALNGNAPEVAPLSQRLRWGEFDA